MESYGLWITNDGRQHHLTTRIWPMPVRTGVANLLLPISSFIVIRFYLVLFYLIFFKFSPSCFYWIFILFLFLFLKQIK
jgi:hypothetical protein